MKNIVKIDLTKYNDKQLEVVCSELLISYELCLKNKNTADVCLAYFDVDAGTMFAYTLNSDPDKIRYFMSSVDNMLNSIPVCDIEAKYVEKIISENKKQKIDNILDKISNFGIDSLLKEELEFLNENSESNDICIDLSVYTEDQIKNISKQLGDESLGEIFISYKRYDVNKVYYNKNKKWILAYTLNSDKDNIKLFKNIDVKTLLNIKPKYFIF